MDILAAGTHDWMRRLFKGGVRGKLSGMNAWNGAHRWVDTYQPADAGYLVGRLWLLHLHTGDGQFAQWALDLIKTFAHDLGASPPASLEAGVDVYYGLCWGCDITGDAKLGALAVKAAENQIRSLWSERNRLFYRGTDRPVAGIDSAAFLLCQPWAARADERHRDRFRQHNESLRRMGMVRADGTSFQMASFDPSERFEGLTTRSGWRVESAWARGQAWGMHGFTAAWEATGEQTFLETAIRMCDWWADHSPPDFVPFYDFEDPERYKFPKDSCAAAIAASALSRVSRHAPDRADRYRPVIEGILTTLADNYLTVGGQVLHGTWGNPRARHGRPSRFPLGDIMAYGNYYFVEALYRQLHEDWGLFDLNLNQGPR